MRLAAALAIASFLACGGTYGAGRDRVPPTFAGLKSAVTCIPGPVGGDRTSSVVRARDAAGNHDHNRRERPGRNLCV